MTSKRVFRAPDEGEKFATVQSENAIGFLIFLLTVFCYILLESVSKSVHEQTTSNIFAANTVD